MEPVPLGDHARGQHERARTNSSHDGSDRVWSADDALVTTAGRSDTSLDPATPSPATLDPVHDTISARPGGR